MGRLLCSLGTPRAVVAMSIAVLLPFLALGFFAQPAADDFVYAARALDLGFLGAQRLWYLHWCGRYFATAIQSGFPLVCDMLADYPLLPLTLLPATVLSVGLFLKAVSGALGGAFSTRQIVWATLAFSAIYLTQMTSVCEGFYWLAGAVSYQLPLVLALVLLACALSIRRDASAARIAASAAVCVPLALAVIGSNETLIPVLGLAVLAGAIVSFRTRHPSRAVWYVALAAVVAGAIVVVTAPGNAERAACFPHRPPVATCLALCAWGTVRHLLKWAIRPALLGATVLLVPGVADLMRRIDWASRIRARHVLLAVGGALGVLFLAFLPAYMGMGLKPPPRALNVLFFVFLAGWFAVLPLAVAWLQNRNGEPLAARPRLRTFAAVTLAVGLLAVGSFPRAVYDLVWLSRTYRQELQDRYAALAERANQATETAAIEPLQTRPRTIHFADLDDGPEHAPYYARYFGLSAVALRDGSEMTR